MWNMEMYILIAEIILGIVVILLGFGMMALKKQLDEILGKYSTLEHGIMEVAKAIVAIRNQDNAYMKKLEEVWDKDQDVYNELLRQSELICEGYDLMANRCEKVIENHTKLLQVLHNLEVRYADIYDQYVLMKKKLETIEKATEKKPAKKATAKKTDPPVTEETPTEV